MQEDIILEIQNLKKYFGKVRAVDGVNLRISRGQVFGFLGPNGSGKTTTIGMILGLIHPTAGSIQLYGKTVTPLNTQPLRRVGSLVGSPSLTPFLSARQNLELLAHIYSTPSPGRIDEILSMVGLTNVADRYAGQFSTGMKQRLGIAISLLNDPEILILDEPTNGMDPLGMIEIRTILSKLAGNGVTIFLSSHLLNEVEQICHQVAVLNNGKIVVEGNVNKLLENVSRIKIRVQPSQKAIQVLRHLPGCREIHQNLDYITVTGGTSETIVSHLVSNGLIPSEVFIDYTNLEEIFLDLVKN